MDDSTCTDGPCASQYFPLPPLGSIVGERYRIVRLVGNGGMGAVFEAEHVSLGRRYAVKFLRPALTGQSQSTERFRREARLLSRLEHEHLAAVFEEGVYRRNVPFLVMEFLEGVTLREWLSEGCALPNEVAVDILLQAARGMAYVHGRGVVHRDLKPSNMMLATRSDGANWLKILDFGIARASLDFDDVITPSGVELGTAHYMSPEQARGNKNIDARSDVYALGTILYESLSGERPHPGESYNAVIFHLLTQPHRPLAELVPDCPAEVVAIAERCLEKEAHRRYADAGALRDALERVPSATDRAASARVMSFSHALPRRSHNVGLVAKVPWFAAGAALGGLAIVSIGALPTSQQPARSYPVEPCPGITDVCLAAGTLSEVASERVVAAEGCGKQAAPQSSVPATEVPLRQSGESPANSGRADENLRTSARTAASHSRAPMLYNAAASAPSPRDDLVQKAEGKGAPDPGHLSAPPIGTEASLPFVTTNPYGVSQ